MKELQISGNNKVLLDDEDFERANCFKWQSFKIKKNKNEYIYAARRPTVNGKKTIIYLHRFILNITDRSIIIDHKNQDTLDNRKENLRICSRVENSYNCDFKHGRNNYIGVTIVHGYIRCSIRATNMNVDRIRLSGFNNEIDAAEEYDKWVLFLRGEFAKINFPEKKMQYLKEINKNREKYLNSLEEKFLKKRIDF